VEGGGPRPWEVVGRRPEGGGCGVLVWEVSEVIIGKRFGGLAGWGWSSRRSHSELLVLAVSSGIWATEEVVEALLDRREDVV
jgi:hypothetical protein